MDLSQLNKIISISQNTLSKAESTYAKLKLLEQEAALIIGEFHSTNNTTQEWKLSVIEEPKIGDLILTVGPGKNGEFEFSMLSYKTPSTLLQKWILLPALEI